VLRALGRSGPREEKAAILLPLPNCLEPPVIEAVVPAVAAYALISMPAEFCTCTVGTWCVSLMSVSFSAAV
jgi:hypothetical protein